jgi:hypothetical protein
MTLRSSKAALLSFLLLTYVNTQAQNALDAGKYGQVGSYGTARSIGFGNTLGSVGGDYSTVNVNPAGLGMYRSSEYMFSPGLRFSGSSSNYTGNTTSDNNVRFGFNNIGLVFTSVQSGRRYEKADWKSVSLGIGINHITDFSRTYNYNGYNNKNSGSQYFEADALAYGVNDIGTPAYLGYQSYLLDNSYHSLVPFTKGLDQFKSVQEKGGVNELAFSLGGNYKEKLLLGATVGIPILNHVVNTSFGEQTHDVKASDSFDHFKYDEYYKTTGSGVNLKLGAIYKFNDYFRAGIAFHTPSFYTLTETSNSNISTTSKIFGTNSIATANNQYEYRLMTPFKAIASVTGILGKHGFISADYEYVNYNSMRYTLNANDKSYENTLNANIRNLYGSASNLRIGTEIRSDAFRFRAGYGFYGSPFKNADYQSTRTDISVGIGYRFENSFIDLGIIRSHYTTLEQPYVLDGSKGYTQPSQATTINNLTSGVFTVGWKF